MRRGTLAWLAALAVAGCRVAPSDGATCQGVANQQFVIAQQDLAAATVDPVIRRQIHDQLPPLRDVLFDRCRDGRWSAQVRDCLTLARDLAARQTCEAQLTDDQRHALDAAARPATR